ncbi:hypothetical protein Patl1_32395 [Pistacia atlantica]|uniref:Uncharacterized protein n=1 Tax=Pistacia atlantica TaxID=434234 RepID=A0ACC1AMF9_9ROSI|nr:hypothetical protein Patl1_32395 [Pistacia atlantica]
MASSLINFDIGSPSHPNGCDDEDYHGTPNNEGEDDGIQEMLNDFENLRDHCMGSGPRGDISAGLQVRDFSHSSVRYSSSSFCATFSCASAACRSLYLRSVFIITMSLKLIRVQSSSFKYFDLYHVAFFIPFPWKAITRQHLITAPTGSHFTVDFEKVRWNHLKLLFF